MRGDHELRKSLSHTAPLQSPHVRVETGWQSGVLQGQSWPLVARSHGLLRTLLSVAEEQERGGPTLFNYTGAWEVGGLVTSIDVET